MSLPRRSVVTMALLAGACSPGVSGRVEDAASGAPVAGATVELHNVGWGTRDGQLVWDAPRVARTTTDAAGAFTFRADGGNGLRVVAEGRPAVDTSMCPRSPTVVRVGGSNAGLRADQRLVFGPAEGAGGTPAAELGLRASGSALDDGTALRIEADGGVRFVTGTGAIPPAPPGRWERAVDLDVVAECGWLFVSDGTAPMAVVQVAPPGEEVEPDGTRRFVMLFTLLPDPSPEGSR